MNVTINRAEMLSAIKRASAVAPADSPLDVLRGALLEADAAAGKLTVTSTNLEAALEEKLPCKWMAKKLRLSEELAHIGGFEMDRCQKLIRLCEKERNKEKKKETA